MKAINHVKLQIQTRNGDVLSILSILCLWQKSEVWGMRQITRTLTQSSIYLVINCIIMFIMNCMLVWILPFVKSEFGNNIVFWESIIRCSFDLYWFVVFFRINHLMYFWYLLIVFNNSKTTNLRRRQKIRIVYNWKGSNYNLRYFSTNLLQEKMLLINKVLCFSSKRGFLLKKNK